MKPRPTLKYFIAFAALLFTMHELHEIAHTSVGRLICGCWGQRDFNVWELCRGCSEGSHLGLLATLAGPVFTFGMIWWGYRLLGNQDIGYQSLGFSLIFANMPIGRLLSAILNSGDETYMLRSLGMERNAAAIAASVLIFLIIFIPLRKAYLALGGKQKIIWFLGFLVLPLIFDLLIVLGLLNTLLNRGILDNYWILGSPMIVSLWTFFVLSLLWLKRKALFNFFDTVP